MQEPLRAATPHADGAAAEAKSTRIPKSTRKRRAGTASGDLSEVEEVIEKKQKKSKKPTVARLDKVRWLSSAMRTGLVIAI